MKRTKNCPFCEEKIKVSAIKCRFCGSFLDGTVSVEEPVLQTWKNNWFRMSTLAMLAIYNILMISFWILDKDYDTLLIQGCILFLDILAVHFFFKEKKWAKIYLISRVLIRLIPVLNTTVTSPDLINVFEMFLLAYFLFIFLSKQKTSHERIKMISGLVLFSCFIVTSLIGISRLTDYYEKVKAIPFQEYHNSKEGFKIKLPSNHWKVVEGENRSALFTDISQDWQTRLIFDNGELLGYMGATPHNGLDLKMEVFLDGMLETFKASDISVLNRESGDLTAGLLFSYSEAGIDYLGTYLVIKSKRLLVESLFFGEKEVFTQNTDEIRRIYGSIEELPVREYTKEFTPQDIFNEYNKSIVLVRGYDKSGSGVGFATGFNLSEDGYIITNLHAVLGAENFDIKFSNNAIYNEGYVVAYSRTDLVLLHVVGNGLPFINADNADDVQIGDKIYVIGNPEGFVNTFSTGVISAIRQDEGTKYYQITAPISSGSSGSPVFDAFGRILGVATFIVEDSQNLNFCISFDEIPKMFSLEKEMSLSEFRRGFAIDSINTAAELMKSFSDYIAESNDTSWGGGLELLKREYENIQEAYNILAGLDESMIADFSKEEQGIYVALLDGSCRGVGTYLAWEALDAFNKENYVECNQLVITYLAWAMENSIILTGDKDRIRVFVKSLKDGALEDITTIDKARKVLYKKAKKFARNENEFSTLEEVTNVLALLMISKSQ